MYHIDEFGRLACSNQVLIINIFVVKFKKFDGVFLDSPDALTFGPQVK